MVNLKETCLFCLFLQRKELLKQREVVEARKKLLQENITSQRKFLGSLLSHLKVLKKASLPVQQQLGLSHTKRMKQHTLAELLPPALYIVYTQLLSHKEAFEEALELEIVGSAKDALTLARQAAMKDAGSLLTNFFDPSELFT
jgi:THO complex subunit 5